MGFDIYGNKPKSEKGEYFRSNVWYWRPLWDYIFRVCSDVITEEDYKKGHYNDGHLIDARKAKRIAKRLRFLLDEGEVKRWERVYKRRLKSLPDVKCDACNGTGKKCNKCQGKGKVRPYETFYPFEENVVREFCEFVEDSGGFRIY